MYAADDSLAGTRAGTGDARTAASSGDSCGCSRASVKRILQDVLNHMDVEAKKLGDLGLTEEKKTQIRMDINACCAQEMSPDFSDADVRASDTLDDLWTRVEERIP